MHSAVELVVERIRLDIIGGAADMAKETVQALQKMICDYPDEEAGKFEEDYMEAVKAILRVTPSFAPPINALHRITAAYERALNEKLSFCEMKKCMIEAGDVLLSWMNASLDKIARIGAEKIKDGDVVFMYSMSSTVWRILKYAKKQGKNFELWGTESRPGNEGLWTINALREEGIPVSMSVDACIGTLVPKADVVFVGADAVSSSGSVFCKAGTYPTALVAKAHNVPFYIAADTLKFESATLLGFGFRSDPVPRDQVLSDEYPADVPVNGVLFDETPPELITALITEIGPIHPISASQIMLSMPRSAKINELIPDWANGRL